MSKSKSPLQSALPKAQFSELVDIRELGLQGMITLRGTLSDATLRRAVRALVGVPVPKPRQIKMLDGSGAAWMGPDELLLFLPYHKAAEAARALAQALAGTHAMVLNTSDARAVFQVSGPHVRDVLAKNFPVDFAVDHWPKNEIRRSLMGQIPAAVWQLDHDSFGIVVFRSVAEYAYDLLVVSSQQGGEVGYH